jgi:hypothetical protein
MSLAEKEDNNVVKVVDLTHKQFDQQFHEDIRSIVHEESDPLMVVVAPNYNLVSRSKVLYHHGLDIITTN